MIKNIGIVVSKFNKEITGEMKKYALEHAKKAGIKVAEIIEVPGAFELPFAVQQLLEKKEIGGVAALGAVIKGQTEHDKVIVYSIAKSLLDLSLQHKKPVSLGVIGPEVTWQQAVKRKKDYAIRSVESLAEMLDIANRKL